MIAIYDTKLKTNPAKLRHGEQEKNIIVNNKVNRG